MCGIAGIVNFDPGDHVDRVRLVGMRDVLTHRGPDGEGLYLDGAIGLAHRRLAIIDVAAGQQPMCNEDGSVWIVYNGEIYNHASLRHGLEARGHRYQTRCDTETILHLYEEKGAQVVDDLQGMFAFAIWDRRRHQLLLARDRLGIKPLYYALTPTSLLFGSEIKAILAEGTVRASFDPDIVPEYLATRFVSGDNTFFQGIRKLMPGHVLTWSPRQRVRRRRYWQPPMPQTVDVLPATARAADMRGHLETVVASHLMSDVPLGVFLSGGIDSSALAALVARSRSTPIQTFAVGFSERDADERPYARLVADAIGSEHRDVTVSPDQFFSSLPKLLWHEDEPIAFSSSVPLYFVARLAREHVKVVLTGEGADELFLGYNRYRVTKWNARLGQRYWASVPAGLQSLVRRAAHALPSAIGRAARRSFLAFEPGIRDLYLDNFSVVSLAWQRRLLKHAVATDPYTAGLRYFDDGTGAVLDRISRADLQTYLVELLMKQDQMSMAASIESRVPFLDDRLVEYVASIPGDVKLPGWETKILLREAVKDLIPPAILTRPKMGFPVPLDRWFRTDYAHIVDEFVLSPRVQARRLFHMPVLREMADAHRSGRAAHGERLWLLINLEIWQRMFCDGEAAADVMRPVFQPSTRVNHGHSLGEDGRPVAVDDRRTGPQPADRVGALRAS
jgi:asparagine synthase (glutamine-hydrolysing)